MYIIINFIIFCLLQMCIQSISSSTQEPHVWGTCEVKFEVWNIFYKKITLTAPFAGYVQCPWALFFEVLLKTELLGSVKHNKELFATIPNAPITTGSVIVLRCHILVTSISKSLYFLNFSKVWSYTIVSAVVMIPPSKPQPNNFFCPPGTKKLNKSP